MFLAVLALARLLHQLDAIHTQITLELVKGLGLITCPLYAVAQPLLENIAALAMFSPCRAFLAFFALELGRSDDRQALLCCKIAARILDLEMVAIVAQGLTCHLVMVHEKAVSMNTFTFAIVVHGDVAHRVGVEFLVQLVSFSSVTVIFSVS